MNNNLQQQLNALQNEFSTKLELIKESVRVEDQKKYTLNNVKSRIGLYETVCHIINHPAYPENLKKFSQEYKTALEDERYNIREESIYETFISGAEAYGQLLADDSEYSALKRRVDNNIIDINIVKVLDAMKQSLSYYIVPYIEEAVIEYVENKTPITRRNVLDTLETGLFRCDPFVKQLLRLISPDQDIRGFQFVPNSRVYESMEFDKIVDLTSKLVKYRPISPITALTNEKVAFAIHNVWYSRNTTTGEVVKLSDYDYRKIKPEILECASLLEELPGLQLDSERGKLTWSYDGDILVEVSEESGLTINGKPIPDEMFEDPISFTTEFGVSDARFVSMCRVLKNVHSMLVILDFAFSYTPIDDINAPNKVVTIMPIQNSDNYAMILTDRMMHRYVVYNDVIPSEGVNVINSFLQTNFTYIAESDRPVTERIMTKLNEAKETYEENDTAIMERIAKVEKRLAQNPNSKELAEALIKLREIKKRNDSQYSKLIKEMGYKVDVHEKKNALQEAIEREYNEKKKTELKNHIISVTALKDVHPDEVSEPLPNDGSNELDSIEPQSNADDDLFGVSYPEHEQPMMDEPNPTTTEENVDDQFASIDDLLNRTPEPVDNNDFDSFDINASLPKVDGETSDIENIAVNFFKETDNNTGDVLLNVASAGNGRGENDSIKVAWNIPFSIEAGEVRLQYATLLSNGEQKGIIHMIPKNISEIVIRAIKEDPNFQPHANVQTPYQSDDEPLELPALPKKPSLIRSVSVMGIQEGKKVKLNKDTKINESVEDVGTDSDDTVKTATEQYDDDGIVEATLLKEIKDIFSTTLDNDIYELSKIIETTSDDMASLSYFYFDVKDKTEEEIEKRHAVLVFMNRGFGTTEDMNTVFVQDLRGDEPNIVESVLNGNNYVSKIDSLAKDGIIEKFEFFDPIDVDEYVDKVDDVSDYINTILSKYEDDEKKVIFNPENSSPLEQKDLEFAKNIKDSALGSLDEVHESVGFEKNCHMPTAPKFVERKRSMKLIPQPQDEVLYGDGKHALYGVVVCIEPNQDATILLNAGNTITVPSKELKVITKRRDLYDTPFKFDTETGMALKGQLLEGFVTHNGEQGICYVNAGDYITASHDDTVTVYGSESNVYGVKKSDIQIPYDVEKVVDTKDYVSGIQIDPETSEVVGELSVHAADFMMAKEPTDLVRVVRHLYNQNGTVAKSEAIQMQKGEIKIVSL